MTRVTVPVIASVPLLLVLPQYVGGALMPRK
jgi:hypothetical protein